MADFVHVARLGEIPPGRMLAVRLEGEDVVLYNVEGAIHASRDFCPHAGYALSKSMFCGKYVRCSLHSWEFDVTSGSYSGNPNIRLKRYPVKVEGEEVWVKLEPVAPPPMQAPPSRDDA